jgi:hypothetical protein
VDLSRAGEQVFRSLAGPWTGRVDVDHDDAARWLRRRRRRWDVVLEDLSAAVAGEVTKPPLSLDVLPALMRSRLRPRGLAITNVLPVPGWTWTALLDRLAAPFGAARVVLLDGWENRVLVAGDVVPSAREVSRLLNRMLDGIGSDEARQLHVRTWKATC